MSSFPVVMATMIYHLIFGVKVPDIVTTGKLIDIFL